MASARPDGYPVIIITLPYLWKAHQKLHRRLPMWVVYNTNTREYPGKWVARLHVTLPAPKATRFVMTHDTVEELRNMLPPGLTQLPRDPNDQPEIVEVWL